jgi:hypothetical protein
MLAGAASLPSGSSYGWSSSRILRKRTPLARPPRAIVPDPLRTREQGAGSRPRPHAWVGTRLPFVQEERLLMVPEQLLREMVEHFVGGDRVLLSA